jgi:hypothetical protein
MREELDCRKDLYRRLWSGLPVENIPFDVRTVCPVNSMVQVTVFSVSEAGGCSADEQRLETGDSLWGIDRKVTMGTRSNAGIRFCERIWTLVATCAKQKKSVFYFLRQAITSTFAGTPYPKLTLKRLYPQS